MKMKRSRVSAMLLAVSIMALFACKKSVKEVQQPTPDPSENNAYVQFSTKAVQLTNRQLYALVSMETAAGQVVFSNKKITLDYIQGVYKTDKLPLAKGNYKLSKFIVINESDTALYAAPKANTAKASQVSKPLSIDVAVANNGINVVAVDVLKVLLSDDSKSYGYTDVDFGFTTFMTLTVKLKIQVGQVLYDSLPAHLSIAAGNGQGSRWSREIVMLKGVTEVRVPETFSHYKFEAKQWNVSVGEEYSRSELYSHKMIDLETSRAPKRLLEETTFIETASGIVADTRSEYVYNASNRLSEIKNYQRSTQVSGLPLANIYTFKYAGIRLDTIHRYAPGNSATGYTAFVYNGGKIASMNNVSYGQQTGAAVQYATNKMDVDYLFGNGNSMTYKMVFISGNRVYDMANSSTGGTETGTYVYDDNINPKHQIGFHDLYFSNASKNNLLHELKSYSGSIPQSVPYKFEYMYNPDGYPVEVFISYKGYASQQHQYKIKKTYRYQ